MEGVDSKKDRQEQSCGSPADINFVFIARAWQFLFCNLFHMCLSLSLCLPVSFSLSLCSVCLKWRHSVAQFFAVFPIYLLFFYGFCDCFFLGIALAWLTCRLLSVALAGSHVLCFLLLLTVTHTSTKDNKCKNKLVHIPFSPASCESLILWQLMRFWQWTSDSCQLYASDAQQLTHNYRNKPNLRNVLSYNRFLIFI